MWLNLGRKIVRTAQGANKLAEQVGCAVEVVERDHFHCGMHISVGDAHQSRGHAGAIDLQGVGVIGNGPPAGGQLVGERFLLQSEISRSVTTGFIFGPRKMTGPLPRAISPCWRLSMVGQSVACVTSTAMPIWVDSEVAGLGAAEADLFGDCGNGVNPYTERPCGSSAECFHHHPHTHFVIHGGRIGETVTHFLVTEFEGDGISNSNEFRSFGLVFGPDIEPKIVQFDDLLAFLIAKQMDRFAAHDRWNGTAARPDHHALANEPPGSSPTDRWA